MEMFGPKQWPDNMEKEKKEIWQGKENAKESSLRAYQRLISGYFSVVWIPHSMVQMQFGGMGFRRLLDFNRALLAKQVWRIIREPNSLKAKVLKARYFKHVDFMDASLGSQLSYIWRSIVWSRDLSKDGLM
ncbi:uncharacterized mitochondrial protein AtMg00310-like [Henckelia pumila]|uniref:uncharacterized mitochondrial protein AtMg00310-like n=1 Tax=Henckelia pumila TaxID=405737 RepID=UPI003C6E8DF2